MGAPTRRTAVLRTCWFAVTDMGRTPLGLDELSSLLGDDLFELVRAHLPPIVAAARVSGLTSPSWPRAAFRLCGQDGRTWKGRRFESAAEADRVTRLRQCLRPTVVAPLIAWRGSAMLTEWTAADVLASRPIDDDLLERAGALLGAVHASVVPTGTVDGPSEYPGSRWSELLEIRLGRLRQAGRLDEPDAARAIALARRFAPPPEPVSLVHGDLCPENLAIDADGRLSIIDTDGLELHARGFDLARARYRWPMTEEQWRVFGRGYGAPDVLDRYRVHEPHWRVVVLAGAADFRVGYGLPGCEQILDRLIDLLREHSEST